jgi:uncharacterized protein
LSTDTALLARLRAHVGLRYGPVLAWDAVNAPMIRHWREAIGLDGAAEEAPATMLPVWLMPGLRRQVPPGSDERDNRAIMRDLEEAGYHGILGTNCQQEYERPLRAGERIACTFEVESVSEEKRTRFGPGFFVTFLQRFTDAAGEPVGSMRLGILRFRPTPRRPAPPRPAMSQDTDFFWKGLREGRLLIQRCTACGTLRHPPGPACLECHALDWETQQASGRGTLHSFVVMHQPRLPAFDYPHPVGLIALEEGVRLVAPLRIDAPERLAIGMPVAVELDPAPQDDRLPWFRVLAD